MFELNFDLLNYRFNSSEEMISFLRKEEVDVEEIGYVVQSLRKGLTQMHFGLNRTFIFADNSEERH